MAYRRVSFANRYETDKIETIGGFPAPPAGKIAPFHALSSVLKLLANKEDTRQVFEIVGALAGGSHNRFFGRFVGTEYGRRVVTEPIKLEEMLGRRDWLRALPDGSLGRAYLDFMEGEDLTPDGITDAANEAGLDYNGDTQFPEMRRMSLHLDVAHDLWHVITGYGRDSLGEICLLIFTRKQAGNIGFWLITSIGALAAKAQQFRTPVLRAMKEARIMGENSAWLPEQDIEALLPMPLEKVRRHLNMIPPQLYRDIPQHLKDDLIKQRIQQTQTQREQTA